MSIKSKSFAFLCAAVFFLMSASAYSAELNFVPLAKKAGPAVVNISTERTVTSSMRGMFPNEMMNNLPPGFEEFFRNFNNMPNNNGNTGRTQSSLGSGFIVSSDGYIVTNNHVVDGADKIFVNLQGSSGKADSIEAKLIGSDSETDIALLKIETKSALPTLKFGNSDKVEVGEWVLAIGNPFGLGHSVTAGIISAKDRDIHVGPFDSFIQTDASINPGNSGGPLVNMEGEVIGINTAILASGQGLGFAIPSSQASKIIDTLKSGKSVQRGWLGVSIQDIDENSSKALGLKSNDGAIISSVLDDAPAQKAGLAAGDVVIAINDLPTKTSSELLKRVASFEPNERVRLTVIRNGKTINVSVVLGSRDVLNPSTPAPKQEVETKTNDILGMNCRALTKEELTKLNLKFGLIITGLVQNGVAAQNGLRTGDIILSANMIELKNPEQFASVVNNDGVKRGAVFLHMIRNKQQFSLALPVTKK